MNVIELTNVYTGPSIIYPKNWYLSFLDLSLDTLSIPPSIISLSIVSNDKIQEINNITRQINTPTDVLSFPFFDSIAIIQNQDISPVPLGEIYLAPDMISKYAKQKGYEIENENAFIFIHGVLHLLGYDHSTEKEEKIMNTLISNIISRNY